MAIDIEYEHYGDKTFAKLTIEGNCTSEEMKIYKEKLLEKAKELGLSIAIIDANKEG